jgi:hypothetical protein
MWASGGESSADMLPGPRRLGVTSLAPAGAAPTPPPPAPDTKDGGRRTSDRTRRARLRRGDPKMGFDFVERRFPTSVLKLTFESFL